MLFPLFCGVSIGGEPDWPQVSRIRQEKVLRIAHWCKDEPPYCFLDEQGKLAGIGIAFARDMARQLGAEPEFIPCETPGAVVDAIAEKRADISATWLTMNVTRAGRVFFSQPVVTFRLSLLVSTRRDMQEGLLLDQDAIQSAHERLPFGALKGHSHVDMLHAHYPGATVVEYEDLPDVIDALLDGSLYAFMSDELFVRRILRMNPELSLDISAVALDGTRDSLAIAVRPDAPDLVAWINVYVQTELVFLTPEFLLTDPMTLTASPSRLFTLADMGRPLENTYLPAEPEAMAEPEFQEDLSAKRPVLVLSLLAGVCAAGYLILLFMFPRRPPMRANNETPEKHHDD